MLERIVGTRISPELVPGSGDEPEHSSEAIVGPYELQDFNLYYLSRFGYRPSKVAFLAHAAWGDRDAGVWPDTVPASERREYDLADDHALARGVPAALLPGQPVQALGDAERAEGRLRRLAVAAQRLACAERLARDRVARRAAGERAGRQATQVVTPRPASRRRAGRADARIIAMACAFPLAFFARVSLAQAGPDAATASPAPSLPTTEAVDLPPPPSSIPAPFLAGSTGELRRLIDAKQYEQAVGEARRQLESAEQQQGPGGEYLQVALMNLALAQYLNQDYVGAEESYLRVISLIEESGRLTGQRLLRAQAGLATTYYAGKRYDLAVARYEQAIALARREQGLFTEEQIPFLERYAAALIEINRVEDALRARRYILRAVERKYGAASLRYAQELESIGRWFTRIGAYDAARNSLRGSIRVIEDAKGRNAAELVGPLTALGDCARRQLLDPSFAKAASADDQSQSIFRDAMAPALPVVSPNTVALEGQASLERAVAIAGLQTPPSQAQIADVRTLLGDWYQSRLQPEKAQSNYQLAWQAAGDSTVGGKPVTELLFGRPVLLAYTPPPSWNRNAGRPADEVVVREAAVGFTVTARGRVAEPKVLSDGGDPKRGEQAERAAQAAIYRPRLANGVPVDTSGITLEQPFYVLVEKEDEASGDEAPASPATTKPAAQAPPPQAPPPATTEPPAPGSTPAPDPSTSGG